jgi:murein DD-endopeptidase MepM/ murein hydrolase activator NlpD
MKRTAAATVFAFLALAPNAFAAGDPEIAALQVGLRQQGLYAGTVDGVLSEATANAVRRLQRRAGLRADGVPGRKTRAALGQYGAPAPLGNRTLAVGMRGWDVAALQFSLAWHGFPSGTLDGAFGPSTDRALRRFQRWVGRRADGRAGTAVVTALQRPAPTCPLRLAQPIAAPYADLFGPRGDRFHAGLDYRAPAGAPVVAAATGRVTHAGWQGGGWGNVVMVAHANGVSTMYAHLSRVTVRVGRRVVRGQGVGHVGSSGHATGPHLHFEVWVRGAAVDPVTALS